jgi:superfamily II DNA or RNA helicase
MVAVAHEPVVLRDYQQDTVSRVCRAARSGARRITVALPTGAGKTEVFAELCRLARQPLVVTPLLELMRQARDRLELRLGEGCEIEQGPNVANWIEGLRARVIVGSRDSLLSGDRYKMAAYEGVSLVVVDECHIGTTPALESMLTHFESKGATVVGFSATPFKRKGKALRYWPRPEVSYGMLDFIMQGWLVGPTCHLSQSTSLDMTLVNEVSHEWDTETLARILSGEHLAQEVTSLVLKTFRHEPSVVYAGSIRQLKLLVDVFDRYGFPTAVVHSRQNYVERAENMAAFTSGQKKVIINVGVLSCGWDCPEVRNIYFASPQKSLSRYEQRLGRGTRTLPGVLQPGMNREERLAAIAASAKPTFHVYDITDSSRSHQILNALDVLDFKSRKSGSRRDRNTSASSGEAGVAAVDAIDTQDAFDAAEQEALNAKRKKLLVGVDFDHTHRDVFSEPEQTGKKIKGKKGWHMFWGKYKGKHLSEIPTGYLQWAAQTERRNMALRAAMLREVSSRSGR